MSKQMACFDSKVGKPSIEQTERIENYLKHCKTGKAYKVPANGDIYPMPKSDSTYGYIFGKALAMGQDLLSFGSFKAWLKNRDFTVGRQALAKGQRKKHAVLLIPGIISSGLESWGTSEEHAPFFRSRIWGTFLRMKRNIEHSKLMDGKKTVLVSHSMGGSIILFFLKWVKAQGPLFGNGGPNWADEHIESVVNIEGTLLGVPKTMAALLSGEMRDTAELNPAGVYILEKLFSRRERAAMLRSWAGSAALWPKGGEVIWGDSSSAPNDPINATMTAGNVYTLRHSEEKSNLTMLSACQFLLQQTPPSFQKMLESKFSFRIESDPNCLIANNQDFRKWTNPLEVQLPKSKNLKILCLYGVGKPTERGYWYKGDQFESDNIETEGAQAKCKASGIKCDSKHQTPITPMNFPLSREWMVNDEVNLDDENPKVKKGIPVITHEIEHRPASFDIQGGSTSADHIDILGLAELNEMIVNIVSGREDLVKEKFVSDIQDYVRRIKWPVQHQTSLSLSPSHN
ncbi:hypothetical protein H4Q26_002731 [Puccinia striiformis f. sp. tritici PST-130]|nr:hypothetical protein H4Q26_002731 [Puccinia striiformis f. sp. tritici PST-130]